MAPIGIGILSFAHGHVNAYCDQLVRFEDVRLVAAWDDNPERGARQAENVGMFFDDAVHAADFLYWLLGAPVSVMAEIDNVLTDVAPDDTGMAIYRYADGAFGLIYNSSVTLAGENTTEVYGDQGVLIQN